MKINLSADYTLRRVILLPLLMFITNTLFHAQQAYVSKQTNQVYGACLACSVQNAQNVVGPNESNYASLRMPLAVVARIEQTLIFPSVKTYSKIVIGIGTQQTDIAVKLLGSISVETFNGNTSNNDYRFLNNEILKIGTTSPTKGTIEITTTKPYDRIVLNLHSGVLNLNDELQIYYAYQLERVYASSETHQINSVCNCSIQNPQNAVGPNEADFSKLIQGSGESPYTARQNLYFPTFKTSSKLVVGVSSDLKPIDQVIDTEASMITIDADNETVELVENKLKKDPNNPNKGTIELITEDSYKGVALTIEHSYYYARELKIHYAYQENLYDATMSTNTMKAVSTEKVLNVFPNPTTGKITLEGNIDFANADIFINNTFGEEVFRFKFKSKTLDLPATLHGGIYILGIQTKDKEIYTHKIILTR